MLMITRPGAGGAVQAVIFARIEFGVNENVPDLIEDVD